MKFSDTRSSRGLELKFVFFVYLGLALVSILWSMWSYGDPLYPWTSSAPPSFFGVIACLALVFVYTAVSQLCIRAFEWGRQLEKLLGHLLTPLSYFQIGVIALLSGFVEEWFFRGILYEHFGVIVSSLVFGACHFFPAPKIWVWAAWSFLAGIVFAVILAVSDSLWLCALTHSAINAAGLVILNFRAYSQPSFRSFS